MTYLRATLSVGFVIIGVGVSRRTVSEKIYAKGYHDLCWMIRIEESRFGDVQVEIRKTLIAHFSLGQKLIHMIESQN